MSSKSIDMYMIECINKCNHKMFCSKGHNIYDEEDYCSWCGESKKFTEKEIKINNELKNYISYNNKISEEIKEDLLA